MNTKMQMVWLACVAVVCATGCPNSVTGNEAGILETCDGVEDKVYDPGTHFFSPICREFYVYNVGTQILTMKTAGVDWNSRAGDADESCFQVQLKGGQKACLDLRTEYEINKATLPGLHRATRDKYESMILRPAVIRGTKNLATIMTADAIYADQTQVELETGVQEALIKDDDLKRAGISIHSFIIERVHLDPKYEEEVMSKSVAQQTRLKEIELALAAVETAKRVAADAQAQVERDRAVAESEKIKTITAAEGEKEAAELRALGLLAQGRAEAEVDRLKRDALYQGEAGQWRARVEIERARAETLKGLLAGVSVIPESAVLQLVGSGTGGAPVTPTVNVSATAKK